MLTMATLKEATHEFNTRHPLTAEPSHALLDRLWRASPPLTAVGMLMLVVAGASLVGIFVDPRIITGAPAWLKPFKFAISTAVYSLTLAWIFGWLSDWPRVRRVVGWTTAIVFVLEVAIIDAQAWRGTTSHFNVSTTLDMVLFAVMGTAILLQTLVSVAVAVALWRQRFTDPALGWALRLGMTLTIVGALTGPLMTRPTAAQLADARAGGRMTIAGAHTVGGVDGGPGVPVTGWSREHGDLRVPHFIGLHAIQALALIAVGLRRWRRPEAVRVRALLAAAASYASLFLLLLWEALRGQSIVAPDAMALASIAIWAVVTVLVLGWIGLGSRGASHATAWIGWQYDSRTALFDPERDDRGSVAAAGVLAAGALDGNGRAGGDAIPARGHLRGAGGCDDARGARAGSRPWRACGRCSTIPGCCWPGGRTTWHSTCS